jgi:hypothetical protein
MLVHLDVVQGFASAMGVLSKVSMLLFTAFFMQIPFREHLLVQGIQVGSQTKHLYSVRLDVTFFPHPHHMF